MVVVPEEVYESLLQRDAEKVLRDPLDNKLDESSANIKKTLRDDKMSPTEKSITYDQELKRLRSLIRQKEERASAPTCSLCWRRSSTNSDSSWNLQGVRLSQLPPRCLRSLRTRNHLQT